MEKRIEVRADYSAGGWAAAMFVRDHDALGGYAPDPEIVALFGSFIIPTPYTLKADVRTVLADLRRLNPDAVVELS